MDDDFDLYGDEEPVSTAHSPAVQTIKLETNALKPTITVLLFSTYSFNPKDV